MKRKICIICMTLCCLFLVACGTKVTALKVDLVQSLPVGETAAITFAAEYDKPDAKDEDKAKALTALGVTYTSSDEKIASVDAYGVVMGVAGGTATITATAGELNASKEIAVLVPLEGVNAPKTLELVLNKTDSEKLNAKPLPANANVKGLFIYKSSDDKIATVDENGTVTAIANGEVTITTTLDSKTAQTKVTVTTAATGIGLESNTGWIYIGGAYDIKPFTLPSEAPASTYTFASDNTGVASVNSNGVITGKSVGSANITITSAEGFSATYTITVKSKPATVKPTGGSTGGSTGGGATGGGNTSGGGATGSGTAPAPSPTPPPAPTEPQHYHGDGSDWGRCPVCGGSYSPSIGVDGSGGDDAGDLT